MTEPVPISALVDPASGTSVRSPRRRQIAMAWIAAGRALALGRSEASWEFADWLAAGHQTWGKDAMQEAAEATGATPGKISHYLKTATVYPPLRRRNGPTFSHHMEVARLPQTEADRVLDQAEAEGWSHRATRAAAREASLEGRLARLAAENRALKRALKAAQTDARDAAAQASSRLGTTRRLIKDEMGRAADMIEELAEPGMLDGLHGNARRGLVKKIVASCKGVVADVSAANGRIAKAATKINGAPL